MKVKELKNFLNSLNDDAEVTIIDDEQNLAWDVLEVRTCEDRTSEYYRNYADIVCDFTDKELKLLYKLYNNYTE